MAQIGKQDRLNILTSQQDELRSYVGSKQKIGTVVFRTAIEAEILFAARVMQVRFFGAVIKPVHPCTGLIARFAQQNALLLRTTDIRVGTEEKTPPEQNNSSKKIEA